MLKTLDQPLAAQIAYEQAIALAEDPAIQVFCNSNLPTRRVFIAMQNNF
ncbi:MAG: hypothetical protein AAF622_10760 [Cyanobacteria bacterium P01_C01_bin.147]